MNEKHSEKMIEDLIRIHRWRAEETGKRVTAYYLQVEAETADCLEELLELRRKSIPLLGMVS